MNESGGGGGGPPGGQNQQSHSRKFLDLGSAFTRELSEDRAYRSGWRDDWRDARSLKMQPGKKYKRYLLDPHALTASSETFICSKYCHTALNKSLVNKSRSPVNVARWTPEGRWLITGAQSGEFTLWNGYDFTFNRVIQGHERAIRTMVWSRSGDWMVSGDHEGFIKVWNPSIRMMTELQGHAESVRGLCFSPTDAKLGSCSDDKTVRVWDFATRQEELAMKGHGFDVKSVDWHLTKGLLVSGSRDNTCKLWSPREGRCIRTISGHKHTVSKVSWHPTCEYLFLSASRDWTVRIHDLRMLREGSQDTCIIQWKAHESEVHSAAWHPIASDLLVTGCNEGTMAFWIVGGNSTEPARQAYIPAAHESAIWDLDWNPLGHMLASGSNDHTAKFWARPKPGDSESDSYRGYQKNLSETDALRASGVGLPISHADREKDRASRTVAAVRNNTAKIVIPGIGKIGEEFAQNQAGLLLAPPTDTAAAAALALEAVLTEQRRAAAQMESFSSQGNGREEAFEGRQKRTAPPRPPREILNIEDFPKPRYRGVVKRWTDKGFGFITPFDPALEGSIFSHATCIAPKMGSNAGEGLDILTEGAIVEFSLEVGENRKSGTNQNRAVYIIEKKFFQSGFTGFEDFPSTSRPSHHQNHSRPPQQWSGGPPPPSDDHHYPQYPPPPTQIPQYAQPMPPQPPHPQYAAPPPPSSAMMQLNPQFVAEVRRLYEAGQIEFLQSQLRPTGLQLEDVLRYAYAAPSYPGH